MRMVDTLGQSSSIRRSASVYDAKASAFSDRMALCNLLPTSTKPVR